MGNFEGSVLVQVLFLAPAIIAVYWGKRKWDAQRSRSKAPFRELRRPAGESLRHKLETLDEQVLSGMVWLIFPPVLAGTVISSKSPLNAVALVMLWIPATVWTIVWAKRLWRLVRERANYQLGFDGERFVGEELNRLAAQGFEVYHDIPFDGFNIDHVLVGPPGVFAVETKTRRKPVAESGVKEFRVEFDGFRLLWPMGADDYGIKQAANNARTLAQWLSDVIAEPVSVTPILTLPGWMVDRKAPAKEVHVVNPKEIIKVCDTKQVCLTEALMLRVCRQLDQKCKLGME